jgi:hypothetical protein
VQTLVNKLYGIALAVALAGCSTTKLHEVTAKYPNGKPASRYYFYVSKDGKEVLHGPSEMWYENGVLSSSKPYVNGHVTGKVTNYPPSGELQVFTFHNDVRHGTGEGFYASGAKQWVGHYKDDMRDGRFTIWTQDGKVVADGEYRADHPWRGTFLTRDGVVKFDNGQLIAPEAK